MSRTFRGLSQREMAEALNGLLALKEDTMFTECEKTVLWIAAECVAQILNRQLDGEGIHWDGNIQTQ